MEIISESKFVNEIHYMIFYGWKGASKNHGLGFKCDKDGNIDMAELEKKPAALDNYNKCLSGEHDVEPGCLQHWEHSYREPAIGRCVCGCTVTLHGFTNTCENCQRDYNSGGQLLAHRSQWGEETGESYCDLQDL